MSASGNNGFYVQYDESSLEHAFTMRFSEFARVGNRSELPPNAPALECAGTRLSTAVRFLRKIEPELSGHAEAFAATRAARMTLFDVFGDKEDAAAVGAARRIGPKGTLSYVERTAAVIEQAVTTYRSKIVASPELARHALMLNWGGGLCEGLVRLGAELRISRQSDIQR